jgi:hypothetical protein
MTHTKQDSEYARELLALSQRQKAEAELKQRLINDAEIVAKEKQRADLHGVIAEAINDVHNTQRFSNSDLMDIREIVTDRLMKNGLMNEEEKDKFLRTVQIFACNDKDWAKKSPSKTKSKSSYLPNAESVDGRW